MVVSARKVNCTVTVSVVKITVNVVSATIRVAVRFSGPGLHSLVAVKP